MYYPRTLTSFLAVAGISLVAAQGPCNPTQASCPPVPGFTNGFTTDFTTTTKVPEDWIIANYAEQYLSFSSSKGLEFRLPNGKSAPYIWTKNYLHYGKVEVTLQSAPGIGVISSAVLMSDTLDEIDWEWSGNDFALKVPTIQTNYFGKGITGNWDRGTQPQVAKNMTQNFMTYTFDWKPESLTWAINGNTIRTLYAKNQDSDQHQYPQSPSRFHLGLWDAGYKDVAWYTKQWAGGETDLNGFPYSLYVKKVTITPYTPCAQHEALDKTGKTGSFKCLNSTAASSSASMSATKADPSASSPAVQTDKPDFVPTPAPVPPVNPTNSIELNSTSSALATSSDEEDAAAEVEDESEDDAASPSSSNNPTPTCSSTMPSNTQPGTASGCAKYVDIVPGNTCKSIAEANDVDLNNLLSWNPQAGSDCYNLWAGYSVCASTPGQCGGDAGSNTSDDNANGNSTEDSASSTSDAEDDAEENVTEDSASTSAALPTEATAVDDAEDDAEENVIEDSASTSTALPTEATAVDDAEDDAEENVTSGDSASTSAALPTEAAAVDDAEDDAEENVTEDSASTSTALPTEAAAVDDADDDTEENVTDSESASISTALPTEAAAVDDADGDAEDSVTDSESTSTSTAFPTEATTVDEEQGSCVTISTTTVYTTVCPVPVATTTIDQGSITLTSTLSSYETSISTATGLTGDDDVPAEGDETNADGTDDEPSTTPTPTSSSNDEVGDDEVGNVEPSPSQSAGNVGEYDGDVDGPEATSSTQADENDDTPEPSTYVDEIDEVASSTPTLSATPTPESYSDEDDEIASTTPPPAATPTLQSSSENDEVEEEVPNDFQSKEKEEPASSYGSVMESTSSAEPAPTPNISEEPEEEDESEDDSEEPVSTLPAVTTSAPTPVVSDLSTATDDEPAWVHMVDATNTTSAPAVPVSERLTPTPSSSSMTDDDEPPWVHMVYANVSATTKTPAVPVSEKLIATPSSSSTTGDDEPAWVYMVENSIQPTTSTIAMTTATIRVTSSSTVTGCPSSMTNCPSQMTGRVYVTELFSTFTTVCPVTELPAIYSWAAGSDLPVGSMTSPGAGSTTPFEFYTAPAETSSPSTPPSAGNEDTETSDFDESEDLDEEENISSTAIDSTTSNPPASYGTSPSSPPTNSPSTSQAPSSSSPPPIPTIVTTIDCWTYIGCYRDVLGRGLRVDKKIKSFDNKANNTNHACADFCTGHKFFATEYSSECYCGDTLEPGCEAVTDGRCRMPCSANPRAVCGGSNGLSLYGSGRCGFVEAGSSSSSSSSSYAASASSSSSSSSTSSTKTATATTPPSYYAKRSLGKKKKPKHNEKKPANEAKTSPYAPRGSGTFSGMFGWFR